MMRRSKTAWAALGWIRVPRRWLSGFGMAGLLTVLLGGCGAEPNPGPKRTESGDIVSPEVVPLRLAAAAGSFAPELTPTAEGGVLLSWLEGVDPGEGRSHRLQWSRLRDEGWSAPATVPVGSELFANWADRPHVVDLGEKGLLAHWLEKMGDGTYTYGIALGHATDGESWASAGWLHDDLSPNEHGFASWVVDGERLWSVWLDGRGMGEGGPMQLRALELDAKAPTGEGPEPGATVLDPRVCECCDTDVVLGPVGPVVAYRDRSDDEVRNIGVVRRTAKGWGEPTLLHDDGWTIHGCPVNGPALAVADEAMAVAWYTHGRDETPRVRLAFSNDGGARFGTPIEVAARGTESDLPLGRVDLELDGAGQAWVLWLHQQSEERAEVRLRSVAPDGTLGSPVVVAETTPSRTAGVPRLGRHGDRLVVAWVATGGDLGESTEVRTAWLEVGE